MVGARHVPAAPRQARFRAPQLRRGRLPSSLSPPLADAQLDRPPGVTWQCGQRVERALFASRKQPVALCVDRAPEPRRPCRRMPREVRESSCTAADKEDVCELSLAVVGEGWRVAPELVADAPSGFSPAVELEVEDDLPSGEEVTAESVRPNGSAQRTLRGSLSAPAPQAFLGACAGRSRSAGRIRPLPPP